MSVDALVAWATANGAYLDPIEIRREADEHRSVFARRAIANGERLVSVPRRMMLGTDNVRTAAMRGFAPMLHSRFMSFAVWLAGERRADGTRWAPYLDALPHSFPAVGADLRAMLDGTRAGELLDERARNFDDDLELIAELAPELASLPPSDVAWGLRVARSRCFRIEALGGNALVPIADMLDHTPAADAVWTYRAEDELFEMRAAREIAAGDEIRHRYGTYDNARWLAGHGFVVENNPDDEVTLRFGPDATVHVGTHVDARFRSAMRAAREVAGNDDPRRVLAVLRDAARSAGTAIARAETVVTQSSICDIVRAGERRVLAEIADFAERAVEVVSLDAAEQRMLAESISPDAVGSDRLLRGFLVTSRSA